MCSSRFLPHGREGKEGHSYHIDMSTWQTTDRERPLAHFSVSLSLSVSHLKNVLFATAAFFFVADPGHAPLLLCASSQGGKVNAFSDLEDLQDVYSKTSSHVKNGICSFFGDLDATGSYSLNSVPVRRSDPIAQQSCQRQILGTNCDREAEEQPSRAVASRASSIGQTSRKVTENFFRMEDGSQNTLHLY